MAVAGAAMAGSAEAFAPSVPDLRSRRLTGPLASAVVPTGQWLRYREEYRPVAVRQPVEAPGHQLLPALPLLLRHFDEATLLGNAGGDFEVYRCRGRGVGRIVEVHVMPLRDTGDLAAFKAQVAALHLDDATYLGWRREVDSAGVHHGLIVTEAAKLRLSDIQLKKGLEEMWPRFSAGLQISESLLAMSKAGYVHGHIEPDNIWVSTDRKGRLTNAMLSHPDSAMHQGDRLSSSLASKSMPKEYVAPELRGGEVDSLSEKTDVYAFGALLLDLLIGHPPADIAWQHSDDFVALDTHFPVVGQLLTDCLRGEPEHRASLADVVARMHWIYGDAPQQVRDAGAGLPRLCRRPVMEKFKLLVERVCLLTHLHR